MRKLKFRAFDKIAKKMFYPESLQSFQFFEDGSWDLCESITEEDEIITGDTSDGSFAHIYNGVIMQYTGIQDKNYNEIYEGDIIIGHTSYERDSDEYEWTKEKPCIVEYDVTKGGFYPFTLNSRWRCDLIDIQVIGNIYQNPELVNA